MYVHWIMAMQKSWKRRQREKVIEMEPDTRCRSPLIWASEQPAGCEGGVAHNSVTEQAIQNKTTQEKGRKRESIKRERERIKNIKRERE